MGKLTFSELMEGPVPGFRMTDGGRGKAPKRVKFFFCGAGRKRKSMGPGKPPKCLPKGVPTKTGAAKIKDMLGRRKSQKTRKAMGPAYKKRVAFKQSIAHSFRKKFGIKNVGKSA